MGYQGFFKILIITLICRKNIGGYKIMKHTVHGRSWWMTPEENNIYHVIEYECNIPQIFH